VAGDLDGGRPSAVREAVTEAKLAAKLTKITERLDADASGMERPGADLIAWYLSPDRLPADEQWSRKHAHTQQRLCERFVAPVIADLACQDIRVADMQRIVNAASTAQEGGRLHALVSALVGAGIRGGYLASAWLKEVHWQAGRDRPGAVPTVTVAGESPLFVDPAEIPGHADVAKLGQALAERGSQVHELMAQLAAYSGLRWGELAALTAGQVDHAGRVITVDRKVVEIGGRLYEEAPKNRKRRRTIYPRRTPEGYPLADRVAARIQAARREQEAGTNPLALVFPSPKGKHWRANNFGRRVLMPSYRPSDGAVKTAAGPGPGIACDTSSAPPRCSPGRSRPATSPAWPGTPTSASPSTCTSGPQPASWTELAAPPTSPAPSRDPPAGLTKEIPC
jgi:integrase